MAAAAFPCVRQLVIFEVQGCRAVCFGAIEMIGELVPVVTSMPVRSVPQASI
jgi:hypothetical protein